MSSPRDIQFDQKHPRTTLVGLSGAFFFSFGGI
jgi:hypothetical protein